MKKTLGLLLLCFTAGAVYAQSPTGDYMNEIGIKGGIAPFTAPHNTQYKGSDNKLAATYGITYHRNITDNWQAGIEAAATRWEANGAQAEIHGLYGQDLGPQATKFIYAKNVFSIMASLNRVKQQYSDFNFLRSSFYYGVSGGLVFTNNDGLSTYSTSAMSNSNETTYLSEYHYQQGRGFVAGVQIGYNYYFAEHFGFTIEGAARFTKIYTDNSSLNSVNNRYSLFYFPVTAGFRFRF